MMNMLTNIIISAVISALLSLYFDDQIKGFLYGLGVRIGFLKSINLNGIWKCSFECKGTTYIEIIKIKQFGNRIIGRIEDDNENYDAVKQVMQKHPLRLTGTIADQRYVTGYWFHPIETDRHHGAFQIIVFPDANTAEGIWVGMSKTARRIESGEWNFEKRV